MKKQIYKLLIGLNIAVIALILLVSGILLYFSSSENHQLFGYSAFLFHDNQSDNDEANSKSQQYSLLFVENKDKPHVGDKATFYIRDDYGNKTQFVDIIKSIVEDVAIFEGTEYTVGVDSDLFIGKVIAQNAFWGKTIASVINSKNTFLIYSILVGCFVIISGVLVVLMIIRAKQEKSDDEPTEEDILLMQLNSSLSDEKFTEEDPTGKPTIRAEHKDGSVFPRGLSHPRLTKSNPLFEPRATRSVRNIAEPPVNMGAASIDKTSLKNVSEVTDSTVAHSKGAHEDIKLYSFGKDGEPIFAQSKEEVANEIAPDTHTIVLSNNADTGELIKLSRREEEDTLNDILRENAASKPATDGNASAGVKASVDVKTSLDAFASIGITDESAIDIVVNPTESSPTQPQDEFAIDPNFDFDSLINEIIHNAEEDFFKNNK